LGLVALTATATASKPYSAESDSGKKGVFLRPSEDTPHEQLAYADGLYQRNRLKRADRQYRALVRSWPRSPEAVTAQYKHATILAKRDKLVKAFEAYQDLVDNYTGRFQYEDVLERQFEIAEEIMNRRVGKLLILRGFEAPERALDLLEKVVTNGPRWEKAPEAQHLMGEIQEYTKQYELATVSYMETMLRYPRSPFAEKSAFGRARCLSTISNESPTDNEAAEEAWYQLSIFNTTYPESEYRDQASILTRQIYDRLALNAYQVATFYDRQARNHKAALNAYESFVQRFRTSKWTEEAKTRIEALSKAVKDDENK